MILQLREQGNSDRTIARHLHIARGTVRRCLKGFSASEPLSVQRRKSLLDLFKPYILARWEAGCRNGSQIYREIELHGYAGSDSMFRQFFGKLRKELQTVSANAEESPGVVRYRISPARASWWFICVPEKLDEAQRQLVQHICAAHPDLEVAYHLTQAFVNHLKNQAGADAVDAWVLQAEQCGIPEFKSFAKGIHHDENAVKAAFSSPWSNGQVEGQVNRLKFQKRMGYGRANFDLLRIRVLVGA
jgi:transposase